jgi:hypothetical protein
MSTITTTPEEGVKLSQDWGVKFYDYKIDGKSVDFQDLMVAVATNRAAAVEKEVTPLTSIIRNRNKELETLGSLLSIFSQTQAKYDSDASGSSKAAVSGITSDMIPLAAEAYKRKGGESESTLSWWNSDWTKASVEGMVSMLKSMIDERNNEAQTDMSRLQSLVDRRDESFTTATNLMSAVSDTRSNLIRNL